MADVEELVGKQIAADELASALIGLQLETDGEESGTHGETECSKAGPAAALVRDGQVGIAQGNVVDEKGEDWVRLTEADLSADAVSIKIEKVLESSTLAGLVNFFKSNKVSRVVCMCGAGISVSAGIPDFRSPGTGVYDNLQQYNLPYPEAVFELAYFRKRPEAFYRLAKELIPGEYRPTPTHHFIKLLHDKGLLLRCYTQNIDSLEHAAGLPADKVVAAHGNFDSARCIECDTEVPIERVKGAVEADKVCHCEECDGLVKPDIVFFGEGLSERFYSLCARDLEQADVLIVMGTSLSVYPFAGLVDMVPSSCPRLLINRDDVSPAGWHCEQLGRDVLHLNTCDAAVQVFAELMGWDEEFKALCAAGEAVVRNHASS